MATDALRRFAGAASPSGVFLDFDGTLSEIVPRPELARPVRGAPELLDRLTSRHFVAIVSGRPASHICMALDIEKHGRIEVFGLYGLEEDTISEAEIALVRPYVETIADEEPEAWLEDKRFSLAVHYRGAADPDAVARRLAAEMAALAREHNLVLLPGKMVIELAPLRTPGKGTVILREVRERGLQACLYAGDDRADLDAYAALDELRADGVDVVKVCVRAEETPEELAERADVVVGRPQGLVELLGELVRTEDGLVQEPSRSAT